MKAPISWQMQWLLDGKGLQIVNIHPFRDESTIEWAERKLNSYQNQVMIDCLVILTNMYWETYKPEDISEDLLSYFYDVNTRDMRYRNIVYIVEYLLRELVNN